MAIVTRSSSSTAMNLEAFLRERATGLGGAVGPARPGRQPPGAPGPRRRAAPRRAVSGDRRRSGARPPPLRRRSARRAPRAPRPAGAAARLRRARDAPRVLRRYAAARLLAGDPRAPGAAGDRARGDVRLHARSARCGPPAIRARRSASCRPPTAAPPTRTCTISRPARPTRRRSPARSSPTTSRSRSSPSPAACSLGAGTLLVLVYNGLLLGTLAGLSAAGRHVQRVPALRGAARDARAVVLRGRRRGRPAAGRRAHRPGDAAARRVAAPRRPAARWRSCSAPRRGWCWPVSPRARHPERPGARAGAGRRASGSAGSFWGASCCVRGPCLPAPRAGRRARHSRARAFALR